MNESLVVLSPRAIRYVAMRFSRDHPSLEDPDHVRDRCMEYCDAFVDYVQAWSLSDVEISIISGVKMGEVPEFPGRALVLGGHFGVLHDGLVYDWTARQFDPDAPVPKITPLAEWREEWTDLKGMP